MAPHSNDDDDPPWTRTTAFPTFLDINPSPDRTPHGQPASATSAANDTTADFGGDDYTSAKERYGNVPSTTGPVGEPGLPPSRPSSLGMASEASTQRATTPRTPQPSSSRRGLAAFGRGNTLRNGGDVESDASRPTSPMSRTHVPSLTPQSFFRPMSSQKLQTQRGQRPPSSLAQNATSVTPGLRRSEDSTPTRHRYSNASVNTMREGLRPQLADDDVPPLPVSRGTMFTNDGTTTGQTEAGHTGAGSVISNNSAAPLQRWQSPPAAKLDSNARSINKDVSAPPPRSPRSLRASLRLSSKRTSTKNEQERRPFPGQTGHEQLHSDPSSLNDTPEKPPLPFATRNGKQPRSGKGAGGAGKNYEYFAGNTLFLLRGRLMNTRAKPMNVATFVLSVLPAGLFFGFSAPWLWHHVSPAIPIIFAYIFYIAISAFLHAAFSDPGILPRNLHPHPPNPDEERDPLTVGPPTTEWVMVKTFPSARQQKVAAAPNGGITEAQSQSATTAMEVPTKYCKSCNIWRPPRAHHCRVCDACIETQDHHCVWLNNCVGRRNYRFFFAYVGFASLLCLMLFAFTLTHVGLYADQHHITFGQSLSGRTQERVAFAMFLYAVLALPYPGSLFIYHLFLIARGETTREYLNSHKFLPKDRHRPFSQASFWRNWVAVLVRPRPPSYMQFRRGYIVGDGRYGHTQPKGVRRVELRGKYSIAGGGKEGVGANGNVGAKRKEGEKQAMEMMPIPPSQSSESEQKEKEEKRKDMSGGGRGGGRGFVDRTPR